MKNSIKRAVCLLLGAAMMMTASCCALQTANAETDPVDDNFRTFYQIFVGSFSDSDSDGIGDLRGIINRFDYLNNGDMLAEDSLGVQGIWLSPIFESPSYHKYDAVDYYRIDPAFGTEEDLKELIALCDQRNVKLILDLVINHTSNRSEWFLQFKEARIKGDTENPFYSYYACVTEDEKASGITYQKISGTDYWYECNFSGDMPELNYDNPDVRQAMLDAAKYYLDLGVDGFRFDAVKYIYFGDTARSVDFWEWYMGELRDIKPDIYCVGECWSGETEILEYCGAMNCFNFATAQAEGSVAMAAKGFSVSKFTGYVDSFRSKLLQKNPEGMVVPFLSNHDMDRIAGAFVLENNMRMAANLYLLCSGSPFIYYGEEIGLRGSRGSANTDANRRLAMLWGDGDTVRDPIGATYPAQNQITATVADQAADENSLFRYYCRLLSIRHSYPAIARGEYEALKFSDKNLGGFRISFEGETLILLHNTSTEGTDFDLSRISDCSVSEICEFIGMGEAVLQETILELGPQTSVILR